jgi:hypothetical protein
MLRADPESGSSIRMMWVFQTPLLKSKSRRPSRASAAIAGVAAAMLINAAKIEVTGLLFFMIEAA